MSDVLSNTCLLPSDVLLIAVFAVLPVISAIVEAIGPKMSLMKSVPLAKYVNIFNPKNASINVNVKIIKNVFKLNPNDDDDSLVGVIDGIDCVVFFKWLQNSKEKFSSTSPFFIFFIKFF